MKRQVKHEKLVPAGVTEDDLTLESLGDEGWPGTSRASNGCGGCGGCGDCRCGMCGCGMCGCAQSPIQPGKGDSLAHALLTSFDLLVAPAQG